MDTRAAEITFLTAIQSLATASQWTRSLTKSLQELPESAGASEATNAAVMAGVTMDRLRTIVKSSQGDSRRGRLTAAKLLEWMDDGRAAEDRAVVKALPTALSDTVDPLIHGKLNDGYLAWQRGTTAYSEGTRQGLLVEPTGFEHSQATDIPRKGEKHKLPGHEIEMPGTNEPKAKKQTGKHELVD
jgi:hypothetical protein